jgi:formamidopyrimidine-DNA glycosylase
VIKTLTASEIHDLYQGIQKGLLPALEKGGAFYEMNLFGEKGKFQLDDIVVGYREGQPCPICQTPIIKIKTVEPAASFASLPAVSLIINFNKRGPFVCNIIRSEL